MKPLEEMSEEEKARRFSEVYDAFCQICEKLGVINTCVRCGTRHCTRCTGTIEITIFGDMHGSKPELIYRPRKKIQYENDELYVCKTCRAAFISVLSGLLEVGKNGTEGKQQ